MDTSSIIKDLFVVDRSNFEKIKAQTESIDSKVTVIESNVLKEGREKLGTFRFK